LAFGQRIRYIEKISENQCHYKCELRVERIAEKLADITHGAFMRSGMKREADALKSQAEST
jgi:hypothetical protein